MYPGHASSTTGNGEPRRSTTTSGRLEESTKERANGTLRRLRRNVKADWLLQTWVQLRQEYWLGRRREEISSRSPGSGDDTEDIEEFPLLLPSGDVRALIEAARLQGLTAPGLARRLIGDYLHQMQSSLPGGTSPEGRSHP
jgi:hypothetical protein